MSSFGALATTTTPQVYACNPKNYILLPYLLRLCTVNINRPHKKKSTHYPAEAITYSDNADDLALLINNQYARIDWIHI